MKLMKKDPGVWIKISQTMSQHFSLITVFYKWHFKTRNKLKSVCRKLNFRKFSMGLLEEECLAGTGLSAFRLVQVLCRIKLYLFNPLILDLMKFTCQSVTPHRLDFM